MTEAEWLACRDPDPMLVFLRGKASDRQLRLFACACCRRIWPLLHPRSQQLVEVSERHVSGLVDPDAFKEVAKWHEPVWRDTAIGSAARTVARTAGAIVSGGAWAVALNAVEDSLRALRTSGLMAESDRVIVAQAALLREVIGNPFRRMTVEPSWRANQDGAAAMLARHVYEHRKFADLPILADALEDAGCTEAIVSHLRSPGPHVRGCWAVDLCLDLT